MFQRKFLLKPLLILIVTALLQACAAKGALNQNHSNLNHIEEGLAMMTVRFKGPYVLYAIHFRNLETDKIYGDLYFLKLPKDKVGENQQDRQHDLFVDMPPGKYLIDYVYISHEAGFTKYTTWDIDFLYAEYAGKSPAYLGELFVSVGDETRVVREGLLFKRKSDVGFAASTDHESNIARLKNRYPALAGETISTGRVWIE